MECFKRSTMKKRFPEKAVDLLYPSTPFDLIEQSLPADVVNKLSHHTTQDKHVVVRNAYKFIHAEIRDGRLTITVDFSEFQRVQMLVESDRRDREMVDKFILLGASNDCLKTLFGLSRREVMVKREALRVSEKCSGGRPSQDQMLLIREDWLARKGKSNADKRSILLAMAEDLGLPLAVIWNAVAEIIFKDVGINDVLAMQT